MEEQLKGIEFTEDDFEFLYRQGQPLPEQELQLSSAGGAGDLFRRLFKKKAALTGLCCLIVIVVLAVIGPGMNAYTYDEQHMEYQNMPARIPLLEKLGIFDGTLTLKTSTGEKEMEPYAAFHDPELYFWFGTDSLGRDIWTRTWTGTRISIFVALIAVTADLLIGVTFGMISGFLGGRVDMLLQRVLEILNSIPNLVIVTLLMLVLKPGLSSIALALVISGWIGMARIARAQVLKLKEEEYVLASRMLGVRPVGVMLRTLLPNMLGALLTQMMLSIPHAIFTETFLAFIGLGVPEPMASLGTMIATGYKSFTVYPYMLLFPLTVMALLMLSLYLLTDGLRAATASQRRGE